MAIAIDKSIRERAKQDGKYMFQISLDPKYLSADGIAENRGKAPTSFKFDLAGPLGPKEARQLWRMVQKWLKSNKV